MVDIKINISDVDESGVRHTRREGYPPIDDQPGAVPGCKFRFYNLGTRANGDEWDDLDDIFETPATTLGSIQYSFDSGKLQNDPDYGFYSRQYTHQYEFISNTYEIELETLQTEFGPNNDDRWERRPIQLANYLEEEGEAFVGSEDSGYDQLGQDFYIPQYYDWKWWGEGILEEGTQEEEEEEAAPYYSNSFENTFNYYFMGDGCHSIRVELISGDNTVFDLSRDLKLREEQKGAATRIKDGVEQDGEIKPLQYVWGSPRVGSFYLRCREVGNASMAHYVRCAKDGENWQIYEDMTQQGIFFYGFDTSDTDQYKITTEFDFDGDEVSGKIIKTLNQPDVQIFLMPRRIAYYARESGLDSEPQDLCQQYGTGVIRSATWDEINDGDGNCGDYLVVDPSPEENPCLSDWICGNVDHTSGTTVPIDLDCEAGQCCEVKATCSVSGCTASYVQFPFVSDIFYTDCHKTTFSCVDNEIEETETITNVTWQECWNIMDQCQGASITQNVILQVPGTSQTHKHTIGLWYGQMPNKAFIFSEKESTSGYGEGTKDDLEDTSYVLTDPQIYNFGYFSGKFPTRVWPIYKIDGYDRDVTGASISHDEDGENNTEFTRYWRKKVFPYDIGVGEFNGIIQRGAYRDYTTGEWILNQYGVYVWANAYLVYIIYNVIPAIYHMRDPLKYQIKNFIEESGGTQEEIDDVVNAIRTFNFFTCDNEFFVHGALRGGRYYEVGGMGSYTIPGGITQPKATWWSGANFGHSPMTHINQWDIGYYPNEHMMGREIWRKIENSDVWSSYLDKSYSHESRTWESKPYGFGIVPGKEGTLVAIIKIKAKVYYVWFKTDEDYKIWGRAKQLLDPENRTWYGIQDDGGSIPEPKLPQDEYELTEYAGYQLGFEEYFCDSYSQSSIDGSEDVFSSAPTGFYNQCAGDGNRTVTHLGRTPVITWDTEFSEDWITTSDITDGLLDIYEDPEESQADRGENVPCKVPFHMGSSANNYKRGTMLAPNEGEFELDAPVVIVGSRDFPKRDGGKMFRVNRDADTKINERYFW